MKPIQSAFLSFLFVFVLFPGSSFSDPDLCAKDYVDLALGTAAPVVEYFETVLGPIAKADLARLVAIPSISTEPGHEAEILRSAHATADLLTEVGLENVTVENVPDLGPIVTANWLHAPGAPTVLIYAHHDVVKAEMTAESGWNTDPFELYEHDGRYYGRGVGDNKGGIVAYAETIRAFMKTRGRLPVNVKLVIEAGEEGDNDLTPYLIANSARLQADVVFVMDSANQTNEELAITTALRGSIGFEITYRSTSHTAHSGSLGGVAPNPVKALMRGLSALETAGDERLLVAGALPPDNEPFVRLSDPEYASLVGLLPGVQLIGGGNNAPRIYAEPYMNVTGITSGATGETTKLPHWASAKITIRTVPGMDSAKVQANIIAALEANNPNKLQIEVVPFCDFKPWRTSVDLLPIQIAQGALTEGFGSPAVYRREGGSIPIMQVLQEVSGAGSIVLYAIAGPDTNYHGPNENIIIRTSHGVTRGTILMFEAMGNVPVAQMYRDGNKPKPPQ